MVRMRGRARPYCPEIWLHLQAQASHQLGPVSRDRRAPETAYPWQFRQHASRVLFAASLWPDGPYRRDEKRCRSILPIRSSIAAMCCLQEPADFDLVIEGRRKAGIEQ